MAVQRYINIKKIFFIQIKYFIIESWIIRLWCFLYQQTFLYNVLLHFCLFQHLDHKITKYHKLVFTYTLPNIPQNFKNLYGGAYTDSDIDLRIKIISVGDEEMNISLSINQEEYLAFWIVWYLFHIEYKGKSPLIIKGNSLTYINRFKFKIFHYI